MRFAHDFLDWGRSRPPPPKPPGKPNCPPGGGTSGATRSHVHRSLLRCSGWWREECSLGLLCTRALDIADTNTRRQGPHSGLLLAFIREPNGVEPFSYRERPSRPKSHSRDGVDHRLAWTRLLKYELGPDEA